MTVSGALNAMARQTVAGRYGPGGLAYTAAINITPAGDKADSGDKRRLAGSAPSAPAAASSLPGLRSWNRSHLPLISSLHPSERLQFFAINALELSLPASDVLLKGRAQWFQLSGHPDSLAPAGPGTVWKRRAGSEDAERVAYEALSACPHMRHAVPHYYREVEYNGDKFIELQDLLYGFEDPHVMDIKMGTRTFLESEVSKTTARTDLYEKMISVDPHAPTESEHAARAVTKLRYMQFRENQSSTNSLGFRIEGLKMPGQAPINELKKIKSSSQVSTTIEKFLGDHFDVKEKVVQRLKEIRSMFEKCEFMKTHEVVGSSLFLIFDNNSVGVWLIDFAKTRLLPDGMAVNHRDKWEPGNHEEGFLYGLDKLITIIEDVDLKSNSFNKALPVIGR